MRAIPEAIAGTGSRVRGVAAQPRRALVIAAVAIAWLTAGSIVAWVLETYGAVPDASGVYLIAVIVIATSFGTSAAVLTSVAAFLVYDFLFTQPAYTFAVAETGEWLNLVLFLLVAVAIGRLAALQAERAREADRRASEAQALFAISRALATSTTVEEAGRTILAQLRAETGMDRMWLVPRDGAPDPGGDERDPAPPRARLQWLLQRGPADGVAGWVRTHNPNAGPPPAAAADAVFRVNVGADGEPVASLWATRRAALGLPDPAHTRLLALAADQLGLALRRAQLAEVATAAEVARAGDALKTALLTSVSHDLRTPLASIRAAAGTLADPDMPAAADEVRAVAMTIDQETQRLDGLVRGLLDLGRIESGALQSHPEAFDVRSLVDEIVDRLRPRLGQRPIDVAVPRDLPPIVVDGLLFDGILTNLLDNVARHAPAPAPIAVKATARNDGATGLNVLLTVEDGGPGVPRADLPALVGPFGRRSDSKRRAPARGFGLSVVSGFAAAMQIEVTASQSALGGLAVTLSIPAEPAPPDEAPEAAGPDEAGRPA